jgi:alpha-D-ribose 1-methylphosphonate 5-triphosphate synthase subunit PhnG
MKTANLHILLFVAFSAILAAGIQAADSLPVPPQPIFHFEAADDIPVIEYNLDHHMLAQRDPTPLLRVYGSGRVQVHFPVYMKKAGDYEMQISRAELNELLRMLDNNGIMAFDAKALRQEKQQLETAHRTTTGTSFHISDATDTVIKIRLNQYQRTASSPRVNGFSKQFSWRNLSSDARRFPGSHTIMQAANAAAILEALCDHPALRKLP